jgi:hypothetical protein
MNFAGLKKLVGQRVKLWPPPYWVQAGRTTPMLWLVNRVDAQEKVVELQAPSGHFFDAADVIHHYQKAGSTLVLAAQVVLDGDELRVEPRPWGEVKTLAQRVGEALLQRAPLRST